MKPFDDIVLGIALGEEGVAGGRPAGVPIPLDQVHPFPTGEAIGGGRGPAWCAATLADELRSDGPAATEDGWPAFDLLLLGVGSDGHLLSVFPGSPALDSTELAMAIPAPTHIGPHVERVTLNPAVVGAARQVLVVVTGTAKAAVLAEIFGPTATRAGGRRNSPCGRARPGSSTRPRPRTCRRWPDPDQSPARTARGSMAVAPSPYQLSSGRRSIASPNCARSIARNVLTGVIDG